MSFVASVKSSATMWIAEMFFSSRLGFNTSVEPTPNPPIDEKFLVAIV
jgi:hypothetical protein